MKQIAIYIAAFLIVCACTSRGRYTAMRHALDSINTLNRTDRPFINLTGGPPVIRD
jgi:hypothetical protein